MACGTPYMPVPKCVTLSSTAPQGAAETQSRWRRPQCKTKHVFLRFRLSRPLRRSNVGAAPSMLVQTDCARQCAKGYGRIKELRWFEFGGSEPHDRNPCALRAATAPGTAAPAVPAETSTQMAWLANLLRPILAFRLRYLPLVMVYFAYGALGLIDVARDMWIKERLTLSPAELAGNRRLAQPAVDRQDGVRRAGRQRSDLGLATPRLYPDRRRLHRQRIAGARRRRRRLDRLCPPGSPLSPRRAADRHRHRHPGRRRRCDVDRGRRPRRRGRQCAARGRRARRARHGPGARPPRAVARHPRGGRTVGMAGRRSSTGRPCFCWA